MDEINKRIREKLDSIELTESVRIVLAVESGSRAWGFPSSDSDFDIRFIYVRSKTWYLSIDSSDRSDVLEYPISDDQLDLSGWDLKKALQLLRKSNPPLLEWLNSPIVYRDIPSIADRVRSVAAEYFSPKACFYHYLHMAQGNYRKYLKGDHVWRKKYFYVLRPVLAMIWLERCLGQVPVEFEKLVAAVLPDGDLRSAVISLIQTKRAGNEMDRGPRLDAISDFLDSEISRMENVSQFTQIAFQDIEPLNELFLETLEEAWNQ